MRIKQNLVWEAYLVIILYFALRKTVDLLIPSSPEHLYYLIIRAFRPIYLLPYIAYIGHVVLNLIHCLPLFLYIHRIRFLNPIFWRCLFVLRCIFEITGHSYEANAFTALYHTSPKFFILTLIVVIFPLIPSYIACYQYAFQSRDKW